MVQQPEEDPCEEEEDPEEEEESEDEENLSIRLSCWFLYEPARSERYFQKLGVSDAICP